MRYGTDSEYPFDTDNRAWRRLSSVTSEHFDAITWTRDPDGRPVLLTLTDMPTGDVVTLAVLDSLEIRDPYTLLAVHTGGELDAYSPTSGATAAGAHAATLALDSTTLAATRPAPLHDPTATALPAACWVDLPTDLAAALHPALYDARTCALVLLDRTGGRFAAVGPFPAHAAADAWQPDDGPGRTADRLIVPLHPVTHQEAQP
ncbi:hypothetical protein GA0070216_115109 [Micromonospora matsumotoense]|uniref:Uncharacterized protein n=1 Tax=Micromonospora matsumotoense TaxID=121616 RepID=A0A1C5ACF1_9ACTN|nr:hypothetical protein [Micromonospora matsumotoense]SCF42694.1 hypothetical protein GA0070216_115109 [Micromonospora matsumotoense]